MKKWLKKALSISSLLGAVYLIFNNNSIGLLLISIPVLMSLYEIGKLVKRKLEKKFVSNKYSRYHKYTRLSNYNIGNKDDELLNMYDVSF
ncbi:hypothetical protein DSAG12_00212 [Promethearchaeum syntrophicum]|uniref:Uncharacterized protein n=1 Tax=Promethearchaeum syntrophicum TaxID=2594042 RepID=A0A5B9D5L1_9ARCH|nr:hypothetical protein [Candidatus Prometheoarchaeum syntrophicum]QEE14399.1 hypothetical protein DSAG12_00212 [Candidatus Prometheoarchaeum syntrophicum]